MEEELAYISLGYHIKSLRMVGLFRLDEKSPKVYKTLHTIYMRGIIIFYTIYTVQQFLKIQEVRDDVDKVMATMFLMLTNTDCIYKCLMLQLKPDQIERTCIRVMKGPIFNQGAPEHRDILIATGRKAILITSVFTKTSLVTCFLWILHPTVLHYQGKDVEFPVWLPFNANKIPQYYVAIFYIWVQTSLLAYSNTTMDVFIAFLLEQCRAQVAILRLDLTNVVQKSKKEAKGTSTSYSNILQRRFNKMIIHHKEIVNTAHEIQDIFGGAVFYQFLVGGWILCCSAYRIVGANPASIEFLSMIMYVMCIVTEIFLYCYYGNEITYETEKLMESAYALDWLEMPIQQRRSLIIFMERIKKPILPMAGFIIPLSNSTFTSIMRSSYSFYAFLKNSEH